MFSGMTNHSIDSKGRIVLPAKFREELGDTFYLAQGFDTCCIQAMSKAQYESVCERILELPADFSVALQYIFTGTAHEVTINAQGRALIPQQLRQFAQIDDEAVVIGMINRIEIWNKSVYDEFIKTKQPDIKKAMSMLKLF